MVIIIISIFNQAREIFLSSVIISQYSQPYYQSELFLFLETGLEEGRHNSLKCFLFICAAMK